MVDGQQLDKTFAAFCKIRRESGAVKKLKKLP
jgi:hypothetical protein